MERLRVLVVDDELGMRLGVARVLQNHLVHVHEVDRQVGFEVTQAETGEEALEHVQTQPPDLMLLDHKLPGISGMEVLERVTPAHPELLTIMITAYASLDTAIAATKRRAYDFLAKPFTPEELKASIAKAARHIILQRQARQLAQEKRQVRFQLLSVLAHELKAPLSAVEGYLNIMNDRTITLDAEKSHQMVERSLMRVEGMRKLIADLLDLTRLESGQKKREVGTVDVRELAQLSIETMQPDAARRKLTVELHTDGPVPMTADRGEIEIVLNNLISNAVKYNRDGGRVDVTIEATPTDVTLKVADTGIGMSSEETARLFGEFVRIKNDKTRHILGSGLGLSILKKLATVYGGDIKVDSTPDVGTTFTVRLSRTGPTGTVATTA